MTAKKVVMWRKVVSHYAGNHLPVIHRDTPKIHISFRN